MKRRGEDYSSVRIRNDDAKTFEEKENISGNELIFVEAKPNIGGTKSTDVDNVQKGGILRAVTIRDAFENSYVSDDFYKILSDDIGCIIGCSLDGCSWAEAYSPSSGTPGCVSNVATGEWTNNYVTIPDINAIAPNYVPDGSELVALDTGKDYNNESYVKATTISNIIDTSESSSNLDQNFNVDEDLFSLMSNKVSVEIEVIDRLSPNGWLLSTVLHGIGLKQKGSEFFIDGELTFFSKETMSYGTVSTDGAEGKNPVLGFTITTKLDSRSVNTNMLYPAEAFFEVNGHKTFYGLNIATGEIAYIWVILQNGKKIPIAQFLIGPHLDEIISSSYAFSSSSDTYADVDICEIFNRVKMLKFLDSRNEQFVSEGDIVVEKENSGTIDSWLDRDRKNVDTSSLNALFYPQKSIYVYTSDLAVKEMQVSGIRIFNPKYFNTIAKTSSDDLIYSNPVLYSNIPQITTFKDISVVDDTFYIELIVKDGETPCLIVLPKKFKLTIV